jgi:tRNA threonylcarbamoyladenosine biosynthesis protein TsaE
MRRHVAHAAMKTLGQPLLQAGLCGTQVDAGHTNLGKSECGGLRLQIAHEAWPIHHPRLIHLLILETRDIAWPTEAACALTAVQLAQHPLLANAVVELRGDLGAGKTTFARHLLRALGVQGTIKSPSYSVMESYELPSMRVSHFDFYRFNDPQEWEDAGFRDVFAEAGLKLVEWPEKAAGLLPAPDLRIGISIGAGEQRQVQLQACTAAGQALLP